MVRLQSESFRGGALRLAPVVALAIAHGATATDCVSRASADPPAQPGTEGRRLSHEETLQWIVKQRAWRPARKTKPIWARLVAPEEVGQESQTADGVKEVAREGAWLCVGVAGEPWFQAREKIEAKYEPAGEE